MSVNHERPNENNNLMISQRKRRKRKKKKLREGNSILNSSSSECGNICRKAGPSFWSLRISGKKNLFTSSSKKYGLYDGTGQNRRSFSRLEN